jgi:hypothetical protein
MDESYIFWEICANVFAEGIATEFKRTAAHKPAGE